MFDNRAVSEYVYKTLLAAFLLILGTIVAQLIPPLL